MKKINTVLISGNFNIVHPGHLRLFRFAKELTGRLIVVVNSDRLAGAAAHIPEGLRLEGIRSNSYVDESFIVDAEISEVIAQIRPDIVVKGKEHENLFNPELDALQAYGGKLIFSSGETMYASIDLLRKEFQDFDAATIDVPGDFMARHNIEFKRLRELIENFSTLKICVVGDLIVDEYITCQALGMSQEDPTLVVTPLDSIRFVGGAGIVACHAATLGASVTFLSVSGNDEARKFALDQINKTGVKAHIFIDEERPTSLKQRYRSQGKSLLRVSHLRQDAISTEIQESIFSLIQDDVSKYDLLVFADFNYGCLPQKLVDNILKLIKGKKIKVAADSQSSSQIGDISRYFGVDLITPTEHEARVSARNHEDGLAVLAEKIYSISQAKNIILKMGAEGFLVNAFEGGGVNCYTDRIRALNRAPKDPSGAGDSLLISTAMALACGANIFEAACLGALTAAIQVGRVGNIPIAQYELLSELVE